MSEKKECPNCGEETLEEVFIFKKEEFEEAEKTSTDDGYWRDVDCMIKWFCKDCLICFHDNEVESD